MRARQDRRALTTRSRNQSPTRSRARWSAANVPPLAARAATRRAPRLTVRDLRAGSGAGALSTACVRTCDAGEIVGIAGIEGNGQTRWPTRSPASSPYTGDDRARRLRCCRRDGPGRAHRARHSRHSARPPPRSAGAGLDDHRERRAGPPARPRRCAAAPRIDRSVAERYAADVIERFDVRPPDPNAIVGALSGGNQQKIVVGRALAGAPETRRRVSADARHRRRRRDAGAVAADRSAQRRRRGAARSRSNSTRSSRWPTACYVMFGGAFVGRIRSRGDRPRPDRRADGRRR